MLNETTPAWLRQAEETLIRYAGSFSDILVDRAGGSYFRTVDGREILDFTSGQMCSLFGHNHPELTAALVPEKGAAIHLLSTILSPPVIELSRALADLLPPNLQKSIFISTGSESNEVAIRMAKLYTGGFEVIGFVGAWHGMTAGAQSHTYMNTRRGYGPVMPGSFALPAPNCYRCPVRHCEDRCDTTCLEVGMSLVDRQSVGAYAAFIAEPILSAAGVIELTSDYLRRLRELCDERGLLLIYDEAQTGMGRLGENFGFEESGVVPDFLTLSKTLGGGLPLAATITSSGIEEACHERGFINVTSHVSDPLPARVGLAVLRILIRDAMQQRAAEMGNYLKSRLLELQEKHDCIGDVRGRGLLLGVEIVTDRTSKEPDPDLGDTISRICLKNGLSMNIVRIKGMGGIFRIAPPLTVSREEIDRGVAILDA